MNGGVILGAYDQDEIIGFLYSFPGFDGERTYLCSHMLGIMADYRKDGLGKKMKLKQAEIAKQKGFSRINWTFDPLESLNAYLNLHKLCAVGARYKENHYGYMNDDLNQGLPTDRIQIEWGLDKDRLDKTVPLEKEKILLDGDKNQPILMDRFSTELTSSEQWFVAIPVNFQKMKVEDFEMAKAWRYKTRKVFQALFSKGYVATDLIRHHEDGTCYYYFSKQD
ncbi:GNAT family N-acetyltransferase [Virgibacillus oceani]